MDMDLSQNPYWRLTKSLLVITGLWPFQRTYLHILLSRVIIIFIISINIPEIIKMLCVWGDVDAISKCALLLSWYMASMIKVFNYYFQFHKLKIILEEIQKDLLSDLSDMEMKIIHHYGKKSKRVTRAYAWSILGCTIMIFSTPFTPVILDIIMPLNESRPIELLYSIEYFVDSDKYKVPLLIHSYIVTPFPMFVILAFDTTYFHCIHHGCSMFAIIRHRIQMITDQIERKMHGATDEKIYQLLSECVEKHVITLKYCEKLESLYSFALLPVIFINTLALSVTGFHTLMTLNDPPEAFKYATCTFGCAVHLLLYTYSGQDLTNHSESVHEFTYNSEWYNMSPKLRIFYILAMIRSNKITVITAGKIYIFSIENFGKVIKVAVSYFTVLLSFQ